jgi:hypothetical protein
VLLAQYFLWRNCEERKFPKSFRSIVGRTIPSGEAGYEIWSFSITENYFSYKSIAAKLIMLQISHCPE